MNDEEIMASVREPFATLHMRTPLEHITERGHRLRWRRRRLPALAAAAGTLAVAAVAGAALIPGSGSTTPAAWAVEQGPANTVEVSISDLKDSAGLQRELAANGVPALVDFAGRSCDGRGYKAIPDNQAAIAGVLGLPLRIKAAVTGFSFAIHPDAIPSGTQLFITSTPPSEAVSQDKSHGASSLPSGTPKVSAMPPGVIPIKDMMALRLIPLHDPECQTGPLPQSPSKPLPTR